MAAVTVRKLDDQVKERHSNWQGDNIYRMTRLSSLIVKTFSVR